MGERPRLGVVPEVTEPERSASRIELMHPPLDRPSGGNVYDRALVDAARRAGAPLSGIAVDLGDVEWRFRERSPALRVWDGLLLERLAAHGALERGNYAVLLHWLPSHDPSLDADECRRREAIEDRIVRGAGFVVTNGAPSACALRARHPGLPISICEPGVREAFLAVRRAHRPMRAHEAVELLTVSNLVPAKSLVETLAVLASLAALPWRWHIVGDRDADPDYARRFARTVRGLGLADRVTLHGPLEADAVVERMDRADAFVFPSRFESYGMVLAEAAARGLPVLATRVGIAPRLFRDGVDALLVPPDDPAALQSALRRMIADAALRMRFRDALRRLPRPRSFDDTLAAFLAAIESHRIRARPANSTRGSTPARDITEPAAD